MPSWCDTIRDLSHQPLIDFIRKRADICTLLQRLKENGKIQEATKIGKARLMGFHDSGYIKVFMKDFPWSRMKERCQVIRINVFTVMIPDLVPSIV
jgi:hypothetical protein